MPFLTHTGTFLACCEGMIKVSIEQHKYMKGYDK